MPFDRAKLHEMVQKKLEEVDTETDDTQEVDGTPDGDNPDDSGDGDQQGDANDAGTPNEGENNTDSNADGNDAADADGGESDSPGEGAELFEVRTPSGTIKVTLDELLSGYMRQSDYTRKTQEIARERAAGHSVPKPAEGSTENDVPDDPYAELELGEYASDTEKKLLEILKREAKKGREHAKELSEVKKFMSKNKGKDRVVALKSEFEKAAKLHGFPVEKSTPALVYKRMGEITLDQNGVPYGDRYTMDMAINDLSLDFPEVMGDFDHVANLKKNNSVWAAIEAEVIEAYNKKKEKQKNTFSPSNGGSQTPPTEKRKFKSPQEAIEYAKSKFKR